MKKESKLNIIHKRKRTIKRSISVPDPEIDDEEEDEELFDLFAQFLEFRKLNKDKNICRNVRGKDNLYAIGEELYQKKYVNRIMKEWQDAGIIQ